MIRKTKGRYTIYSKKGKKLATRKTKKAADKRLRQIEYFKRKKK